jgi:long-subunit fatty acid transport protein
MKHSCILYIQGNENQGMVGRIRLTEVVVFHWSLDAFSRMKKYLLSIIALSVCVYSFAQSEVDAHRFSVNDLSGTARGQAMGGAFGALGGDVTGVAINPAGIGIYRSSEIVGNLSIASNNAQTEVKTGWNGEVTKASKMKVNFDNLSYIGYYPLVKGSMLSLNFGFNYNRLKNFDRKYRVKGTDMPSSLIDYMTYHTNMNSIPHSFWDQSGDRYQSSVPWLSILAWDSYLISEVENTSDQYKSILYQKVNPDLVVSEKGNISAYDFTIGSNVANKFFWGVTFALTDVAYVLSSTHSEVFQAEGGKNGFSFDNSLDTDGSGFQFKTGVIFIPIDALRLGISYHSPTWFTMTDYYHAGITPRGLTGDNGQPVGRTETPVDNWKYRFTTPSAWTFSAAAIIGSKAIVSLDYEIKDYSAMNFDEADSYNYRFDYGVDNKYIDEDFKWASTVRAGLEVRFTPQFSGRLGYAYMQNPYQNEIRSGEREVITSGTVTHFTIDGDVSYFTTGIGYRFTPQFYMDAALVFRHQANDLYFYSQVPENVVSYPASYANNTVKGLITLGYKF